MTAVEWLYEQIKLTDKETYNSLYEQYQQANKMFEQQIKDSFIEGHNVCRCVTDNPDEAKECFDEWFKTFKKYNK